MALNTLGRVLPRLQGAGVRGPAPSAASVSKESKSVLPTRKKTPLPLFVIAAPQRKANFGNRLLKKYIHSERHNQSGTPDADSPGAPGLPGNSRLLPGPQASPARASFPQGCPGSAPLETRPWSLRVPPRTVRRPGRPFAYSSGRLQQNCAAWAPGSPPLYSPGGSSAACPQTWNQTANHSGGHKEPECLCRGHLCNGKCCLCRAPTHGSLPRVWEPSAGVCLFSQELPPSLATETGLLGLHKTDRILEVKPPGTSGLLALQRGNQGPRGHATCPCVSQSTWGSGTLNLGKCQTPRFTPLGWGHSPCSPPLTHPGTGAGGL